MTITSGSTRTLMMASVVWALVVVGGLASMWAYAERPGPPTTAGPMWPTAARLRRDGHTPTLVMFLHPQCACSRASVAELGVLLARVSRPLVIHMVVYRPAGAAADWEYTDLWDSAEAIPAAHVTSDEDGAEARVFGALVSGSTLLYDGDGRLLFNGGITSARGHAGDNAGLDAVASLLAHEGHAISQTPVFGCLLHAESDAPDSSAPIARTR